MWIYKAHSVSKQAESEAPKIKIKLSKLPPIEPNIINFFFKWETSGLRWPGFWLTILLGRAVKLKNLLPYGRRHWAE